MYNLTRKNYSKSPSFIYIKDHTDITKILKTTLKVSIIISIKLNTAAAESNKL